MMEWFARFDQGAPPKEFLPPIPYAEYLRCAPGQ